MAEGELLPTNQSCLIFAAIHYPPHTIVQHDINIPITGWVVDLAEILGKKLGFCFRIIRPDTIGGMLPNGSYTGLTGWLNRSEIDMSITPLAVTPNRKAAYDFTKYLFMDQQQVITKYPRAEADVIGFVKPFVGEVWSCILAGLLVITIGTFFVDLTSSWVNDKIKTWLPDKKPKGLEDNFSSKSYSFSSSVYKATSWTIYTLLGQSMPWEPKGAGIRTVTGVWLFISLILGTVYRSNLKAMLILPKVKLPFNNFEELLDTSYPIHLIKGSLIYHAIMNAPDNTTLGKLRGQTYTDNDPITAIERIYKDEIVGLSTHTAQQMLSNWQFSKNGKCMTYSLYQEAIFKGTIAGWPIPRDSPWKERFDDLVERLREFGIINRLHKNYIVNSTYCFKPLSSTVSSESLRNLELKDFYGVLLLYLGGMFTGLLAFVVEKVQK